MRQLSTRDNMTQKISTLPGITSPDTWNDHTVRCAVLSLLKEMGQTALAKLCPLQQSAISNIANWKYNNKLSDEKCAEFGKWYTQYMSNTTDFPCDFGIAPKDSRLTFHPDHEIPEMRQWYKTCKNPTEHKLNSFANELNKGHVRQERPKVTVAKLKIWWKNERQREKKINKSVKTSTVTSTCSLHNVNTMQKTHARSTDSIDIVQQSLDIVSDGSETFQKSRDQFEEPVELLEQLHQSDDVTKGDNQTERKSYVTLQTTSENSLNINPMISAVPGMPEMNYNQNRRMENISESSMNMNRFVT